ncbi:multidrug ABC transporter ATPase [Carbonactinospora thermoautotrophica]|uniref:Multidrug ABC transporter ATPase n=1 Tax=Carbonactinospora thermoautotrophica TaxID=1469144 RepID=A0A132N3L9_9ACTN|nr:multidrug ABC transporter ATPase [Carbonactinospora thermoautotrophica]KWX06900.1 multidrug ABC transporter ATPase [Carbonactinospora thermoautotrophica]
MPRPPAIRTVGLRKTYSGPRGEIEAVAGIDLTVAQGEFFGLLGPNGAGKSTTIGMLTTRVIPAGGQAFVYGIDVRAHPVEVKRHIGVVSQHNTLDRRLDVAENLEFRGRYFGMSAREARRRAGELLDLFNLGERRKAMVYELSGGQAQRLLIARALAHRPPLLFLDEPTAGIDPQTRLNLWETLRRLHAEGQTILLTTHYLEEAETLCERVAIIDHGQVLACDTVPALKKSVDADTVFTLTYADDSAPVAELAWRLPGVRRVESDGPQLRVFASGADGLLGELIAAGAQVGRTPRDAATLSPSLETVFLTLTGREYRE